jgi:multidrug efflux pump subunit AcrA (membrane-fusion protein)
MRVSASRIDKVDERVSPGQKVTIRVDAFPNESFTGTVETVPPLPDPGRGFNNVYTTKIRIDNPTPMLRPGMTAEVRILIDERGNVLTVPTTAVIQFNDQDHVAISHPDGSFTWRPVRLGATDDIMVEVKGGLEPKTQIYLQPLSLLSAEEQGTQGVRYPVTPPPPGRN